MEDEDDIPHIDLKGNQVSLGMKQCMEAVNEHFEVKDRNVEHRDVWVLSNQRILR